MSIANGEARALSLAQRQETPMEIGAMPVTPTEPPIHATLNEVVSAVAALRKEVTGLKKQITSVSRGGNDQARGENQNNRTANRDMSNIRCYGCKEVGHIKRNCPSRNATDARITKLEATIAALDLSALKNQGN